MPMIHAESVQPLLQEEIVATVSHTEKQEPLQGTTNEHETVSAEIANTPSDVLEEQSNKMPPSEFSLDVQPEFHSVPVPPHVKQELHALEQNVSQQVIQSVPTSNSHYILRYIVRGGLLLTAAILGIVLAFVVKSQISSEKVPGESVTETVTLVSNLTGTDRVTIITLEGSPVSFRTTLNAEILAAPAGLTEIQPHVYGDVSSRSATTQEILPLIAHNLSAGTARALDTSLTLGSITVGTNEPFIILRSANFDTLFTGMLAWEANMHADLAPLFGVADGIKRSFSDAIRGNASTRILYDTTGKEVLLYSFINQRTVVITTSSTALSALVSRF
jgi:hypothetical protein